MRPTSLAPLLLAGCVATTTTAPAVAEFANLRPEARTECAAHCAALGLELGAVVLVMNAEGCVCEPAGAKEPVTGPATPPASPPIPSGPYSPDLPVSP